MSYVSRVFSLARNRQRILSFADRPVPPDLLERIVDCGRYATSAREAQPWRFVIVQSLQTRVRIAAECFNQQQVRSAPCLVLCCARIHSHITGSGRPSHPADVAAATQAMIMAASDLGLASLWITGFRESGMRDTVGIPQDVPIVSILGLGYPERFGGLPDRLPKADVIGWETWSGRGVGPTG
ncbi:MAG: nitroreductase family protein [Gemmatimonadota bacterium]